MATVYSSADRSRFFIVPEGVKLRAGGMRVQSLAGEQIRVDGQQIAPFEVPEEEARRHVEERLASIEVIRRELLTFAETLRALGSEIARDPPPERVAALMELAGVTNLDLVRDPTGTLKRVVTKLTQATKETLAPLLKRSPT